MMYDNRINEMDMMESYETMMAEVAEEADFEEDIKSDPYDNAHWADRLEEALNPDPLHWSV